MGSIRSDLETFPCTELATQEAKTLKKIGYLEAKKLVCSDNQGKVSYALAVKSAHLSVTEMQAVTSIDDRCIKQLRNKDITRETSQSLKLQEEKHNSKQLRRHS